MSIICKNGTEHRHETVAESKACWFPPVTPTPAPIRAGTFPIRSIDFEPITVPQLEYIEILKGDMVYAAKLSKHDASEYIKKLKTAHVTVPAYVEAVPTPITPRRERVPDPRLKMVESLLVHVPDGYYATAPEGDGGHVDFIRINRPKKGRFNNCIKIQSQHSEVWRNRLIRWPSGYWEVDSVSAIGALMLVISDAKTCARRYAIELQHCQRCNKQLTDDRSRHYLIGPECEQKYGGDAVIEEVDLINDGMSYEQLVHKGLPTRVWQETAL